MKLDFGKYRGIIVSVALFLLLDASVLLMNFYISFEISEDAVGVNLAGRQRMLSQRMMKSLLDLDAADSVEQRQLAMAELSQTVTLFDNTLRAFASGGETLSAEGHGVMLGAVNSPAGRQALEEAKTLWLPFLQRLDPLIDRHSLGSDASYAARLHSAVAYGRANNLTLLRLMNALTVDLENVAASKAKRLRLIQTVGISLAVLNFFIIMFHFLRQLRESDSKIESARQETREILDTVNEGLFLLDRDQHIGSQYSHALLNILGQRELEGVAFAELLDGIVSDRDRNTAAGFIKLLFDPRKKQKLIGDLNPLRQVEVHIPQPDGSFANKHLSFGFSRVVIDGEIVHVLVTVQDISRQIKLADELEAAKVQGEEQLELLSTILQSNGDLLRHFLSNSFASFQKINGLLKQPAKTHQQYIDKANQIFALIHNYKGEAAALELHRFARQAHQFEELLDGLRRSAELSGNDFLGLVVHLNKLIAQTETIQGLVEKLGTLGLGGTSQVASSSATYAYPHWSLFAEQVAERQGKEVELLCSGFNDVPLSETMESALNTLTVQLIRNAISHGIETPEQRRLAQKPPRGEVDVRLLARADGSIQLSVEDDGDGIDRQAVIDTAVDRGLIDSAAAESLDSKAIMNLIFHPQLSTRSDVDEDAGRGVGMHAIREVVRELGGRVTIQSRRGRGTRFQLFFPAEINAVKSAA